MATGAAAAQAAQRSSKTAPHKDDDRGPGSVAGNIVRDPELRYTATGKPVSNIRIASSERVRDAETGQWRDGETVYYDLQLWGQVAENTAEYLQRGDRIVAEGRWKEENWEDKDGEIRSRVVLVARDLGPSLMFRGARPIRKGEG